MGPEMQDLFLQNLFNLKVTKMIPNFHPSSKSYTFVYPAYVLKDLLHVLAILARSY